MVEDLKGGTPQQNGQELKTVLAAGDHSNAKRDSIVLNAAFGLYVYGMTTSVEEGIALARKTLNEGKAIECLNLFINESQKIMSSLRKNKDFFEHIKA